MTETRISADFRMTLHIARKIHRGMVDDYREECEQAYADGHRPHYCIHGTDQWTDYDNICWGCEEGVTQAHMATQYAAAAVKAFHERMALATQARSMGAPGFSEKEWGEWAWAAVSRYFV